MFDDGIEDDEEFTHAGDEGNFWRLARGAQPQIKGLDLRGGYLTRLPRFAVNHHDAFTAGEAYGKSFSCASGKPSRKVCSGVLP